KALELANTHKPSTVDGLNDRDRQQNAFAAHLYAEAYQGGNLNMTPYDPYRWQLEGFALTIRTGAPNLCDGRRAAQAAYACYAGKEAAEENKRVELRKLEV